MEYFSAVWLYDNGTTAYVNNTVEAEISGGTDFELMGETTDYQYFGFSRRFEMLIFTVGTVGSYGARTWEYTDDASDADSWARSIPLTDDAFASSTSYTQIKVPSDWASVAFSTSKPHAVAAVPDTTARYWLRCSVASVTTTAEISRIQMIPYARYTDPDKVASHLQIGDFSSSTQPTYNEVEDRIHEIESQIDYQTKKSWRYRIKTDEEHEFNLNGIRLMRKPIRSVSYLKIWNGSEYDTKTEARTSDFFYVAETGMIYFARYFLLPARLAMTGPHWWGWGLGEFTFPIQVKYVWGDDLDTSETGPFVTQLASKMTCVELYRTHEYSILAVSGLDKIPLDRKVDQWKLEIDDGIDSLRSIEVL